MNARPARLVAVLLSALLASSCGSRSDETDPAAAPSASASADCTAVADEVVATTRRYLDSFSAPAGSASPAPSAGEGALSDAEWTEAVGGLQSYAGSIGCDPEQFAADVDAGLAELDAPSPLARALLLQLRAGAPRSGPRTVDAAPDDDLAALVAGLPEGSTVRLAAGTYALEDPLVLLRGVTLAGQSRDSTAITSGHADGVLLAIADAPSAVSGVELRRGSEEPGPVVVAGPLAQLELEGVRVTGARADSDGAGGAGVVVAPATDESPRPEGLQRPTAVRVQDSEFVGNESSGIVVSGTNRVEVRGTTVRGAGQCGLCFLDTSDGVVDASTLEDNRVGVLAVGQARPVLTASTVRGGEVAAQADEQAGPVLERNTLVGSARAAVILAGSATGRLDGNRCESVPVGIVVGPQALPELGENPDCQVVRGP